MTIDISDWEQQLKSEKWAIGYHERELERAKRQALVLERIIAEDAATPAPIKKEDKLPF